ncbi:FecCD family ABC transporter permease [Paenibacillus polymyxa]|uniref:FecCD family ABC transporter permease n=1 Tax=Paenibacillus polymyxa TaxID=1406 RepID=UPI00296FBA90|nr:iron ABC transporter permease [Paenibacillus polymyxa]WOZ38370.1 iron ABC transporter permease [Paenibacillus polymyxa]
MIHSISSKKQSRSRFLLFLFLVSLILLILGLLFSLKWGPASISWAELYQALTYQHSNKVHLYIQTLRLPRTLTACMVGTLLALAGLLTQLTTRNPLASPHVFGINAGASLAVVLGLVLSAQLSATSTMLMAFAGAAAGAWLVWSLAGFADKQPVRLALAGITIHFMLSSLTEGFIILNQYSTESMIFWLAGSVSQAGWTEVRMILPFFITSLVLLVMLLPALRLLLLEDEIAAGLGQRVPLVRALALMLVIVMAGSAVAVCGPIGFVCLIVPHIARALVGTRLSLLVPMTALGGGLLLVYADLLSRIISFPFESPVGIVTSAVGGPFFIYLARKKRRGTR